MEGTSVAHTLSEDLSSEELRLCMDGQRKAHNVVQEFLKIVLLRGSTCFQKTCSRRERSYL
jgi:hypothetical protein